jgi:hypothetical protein
MAVIRNTEIYHSTHKQEKLVIAGWRVEVIKFQGTKDISLKARNGKNYLVLAYSLCIYHVPES